MIFLFQFEVGEIRKGRLQIWRTNINPVNQDIREECEMSWTDIKSSVKSGLHDAALATADREASSLLVKQPSVNDKQLGIHQLGDKLLKLNHFNF